jgi:hypothetical protein
MIQKCDDCEYALAIADLMVTLDSLDFFVLKIWIGGRELPFKFDAEHTLTFLQEGIRAEKDNRINYVFYDSIDNIMVIAK